MRLYVAGKITGIPDFNISAFRDAEAQLLGAGYDVSVPHDNGLELDADWCDHLRADIRMLLDCDGVALLEDWTESRGARLEEQIAHRLGMPRRPVREWLRAAQGDR